MEVRSANAGDAVMGNDISRVTGTNPRDAAAPRATRAAPEHTHGTTAAAPADAVTLSADASKIINIESKLKHLPEVDAARVERIRTAVANGDYHIDPRRVAQKFLELDGQL